MRIRVLNRQRWNPPDPRERLDIRVCPHCGAPVYGRTGQARHDRNHTRLWEWMDWVDEQLAVLPEMRKRTGMAEEAIEIPARYSAEVTAFYPDSDESEDEE